MSQRTQRDPRETAASLSEEASALIEKHLDLVDLVVAVERKKLGITDDALEQDMRSSAMMGLVHAVGRYDPDRSASFTAFLMGVMASSWDILITMESSGIPFSRR